MSPEGLGILGIRDILGGGERGGGGGVFMSHTCPRPVRRALASDWCSIRAAAAKAGALGSPTAMRLSCSGATAALAASSSVNDASRCTANTPSSCTSFWLVQTFANSCQLAWEVRKEPACNSSSTSLHVRPDVFQDSRTCSRQHCI